MQVSVFPTQAVRAVYAQLPHRMVHALGIGGRREITIPPGPGTQDGRASNATEELVYDVSLLRVSVPPS